MVVKDGMSVLLRGRGIRCDQWCTGCITLVLDSSIVLGGLLEGREEGLIRQFGRETGKVLSSALIAHTVQ